jgi:hypothetical protein
VLHSIFFLSGKAAKIVVQGRQATQDVPKQIEVGIGHVEAKQITVYPPGENVQLPTFGISLMPQVGMASI